jgi:large subunit ribosomal protein L16
LLAQPLRLNSRKIFRLKLFLKRAARRSDKTRRKVWVNVFPYLPLTKKVIGSRMGKGKGKLSIWLAQLNTGHVLIEFKNLRSGRAVYYLRQSKFKLKSLFRVVWACPNEKVVAGFFNSNQVRFQSFW